MSEEIKALARAIAEWLTETDCVMNGDGTIHGFKTRREIADEFGFTTDKFVAVKEEMLRQGFNISFIPGRGHFIGDKDARLRNVQFAFKVGNSWLRLANRYSSAIRKGDGK